MNLWLESLGWYPRGRYVGSYDSRVSDQSLVLEDIEGSNLDINGRLGRFDMIVHRNKRYRDIKKIHGLFFTLP